MDDLRTTGEIVLNINRAKISSSNCIHPLCSEKNHLRRISLETRYNFMKENRFYVPPRGLGCDLHRNINAWSASDFSDSIYPFTQNQIHDMVDLLRFQPKKLNFNSPGR